MDFISEMAINILCRKESYGGLVMSALKAEWGSGNRYTMCLPSLVYKQLDYRIAFPIIPRITVQPTVSVMETHDYL